MIKSKTKTNTGFIALMSAIIISAILLLIVTSLSFTGFYSRSDILDSELKERSSALADACVDDTLLKLRNDPTYNPVNETIIVDEISGDDCVVKSVSGAVIKVQGEYDNKYFTNLKVGFNPSDMSIISWEETPN